MKAVFIVGIFLLFTVLLTEVAPVNSAFAGASGEFQLGGYVYAIRHNRTQVLTPRGNLVDVPSSWILPQASGTRKSDSAEPSFKDGQFVTIQTSMAKFAKEAKVKRANIYANTH